MNRKKYCIILLLILTTFATVLCTIIAFKERRNGQKKKLDIELVAADIHHNNVKSLVSSQKETMLIFFNTECDYCTEELFFIKKNINTFIFKYNIILVSFEDQVKLRKYERKIANSNEKISTSFIFISDTAFDIIDKYDVSEFPSIFLFSREGVEIGRSKGVGLDFLKQLKDR